ncbi:JmjC-domain-containing protein, partial [Ramicandelaber brevisporus]
PVFYPTMEEFEDFERFIHTIQPLAINGGVAKVVPPKEWREKLESETCKRHPAPLRDPIQLAELEAQRQQLLQKLNTMKRDEIAKARRRYNKGSIMDFRSVSQGAEPLDETETAGSIVEKNYWNDIKRTRPTYGADILGSLFPPPEDFKYWNLQDLGTILSRVNVELAGINDPYLYVGMYRATFAWHTEDLDLYSINYVHYGSPKSWFAIPIKYCTKFEAFARSKFPEKADRCSEFMRHKTFHINPDVLEKAGIPVQRMVQNAGEFVITFPRGYHAGFNQGFNVAEAVNFAMPEWVPIGAWAKFCLCQQDSVRIDVRQFF